MSTIRNDISTIRNICFPRNVYYKKVFMRNISNSIHVFCWKDSHSRNFCLLLESMLGKPSIPSNQKLALFLAVQKPFCSCHSSEAMPTHDTEGQVAACARAP